MKIAVVGPVKAGKSVISNFLADATESSTGAYYPTQGVRILEFESGNLSMEGRNIKAEVELWDCSGDPKFENCWPAIRHEVHGIIFVYNQDEPNHDRELDKHYTYFTQTFGAKENHGIVFAHRKRGASSKSACHLSSLLSKLIVVHTDLEEDAESVRAAFHHFLAKLLNVLSESQRQQEVSIVNY